MHRIDSSTATPDNRFTEGDPTIPVAATTVTAAWLNAIQEEVVAVLDAAEIAPDKADNAQVLAAITKLIADKIPDVATLTTRGIGRIATSADLADGAEILSGPAFLAAALNTAVAAASGKIPVSGPNSKLASGWVIDVGDVCFSYKSAKDGWLLCNGAAVSRTTYAALFAEIGTKFGVGDGSTTFNLPDTRGRVLQGANGNLGSYLAAGLPDIVGVAGSVTSHHTMTGYDTGAFKSVANVSGENLGGWTGSAVNHIEFKASWSNSTYGNSTTVQPPAVAMNVFIKY